MPAAIPYPVLEHYLGRLPGAPQAGTSVWTDSEGLALGRYFNATLTSAFQAIRDLAADEIVGYEGFARSYSESDPGLCVWKLLDQAANDDESVELDRLCRMLHSVNFFRQPESAGSDLYLSVHARLLAAVDSNHGNAFCRILKLLELPQDRVVLQLPVIDEHPGWLVNYVADNYRRNGFRLAVNINDAAQGMALLQSIRPEVVKVDARAIVQDQEAMKLVSECGRRGIRTIFKRVENTQMLSRLERFSAISGQPLHAQGFLWDLPRASLAADRSRHTILLRAADAVPALGVA